MRPTRCVLGIGELHELFPKVSLTVLRLPAFALNDRPILLMVPENISVIFPFQLEAEPEVEHMFVSDITDESFQLAWTAGEDLFDRFVIKIRDIRKTTHPQEFNAFGDERTKVLTGLTGGTEYEIELFGVTLERHSQSMFGVARTGIQERARVLCIVTLFHFSLTETVSFVLFHPSGVPQKLISRVTQVKTF